MSESETTTTTAVPSSSVQVPAPVTREELVELIQAIRFAKPEVSQRQVHREITQDLSKKDGFQFLEQVEFKHMQKAWKRAVKEQPNSSSGTTPHAKQQQQQPQQENADLLEKLQSQTQPPELFTIGHNQNHHSIQFLAQEYTAAQKLAEHTTSATSTTGDDDATSLSNNDNYVHVFLDVPHDKTGSRPHEALIHFQKPTTTTPATTTTTATVKTNGGNPKSTNKKKSHSKKSKDMSPSSTLLDDQGRMIVKIQRAAPRDALDTTKHPLLLYNQTRTYKTFIHPDEGYDRIVAWMDKEGQTGVLGITGGAKAYYYARLTLQKGQPNILSIDVTQLAPPQEW